MFPTLQHALFSPPAPHNKSARPGRRARYAATVAGVLTLASCSPALAAGFQPGQPFYENGCTVHALPPYQSTTSAAGERIARFPVNYDCLAGVSSITVRIEGWDIDTGESSADDRLFSTDFGPYEILPRGESGTVARTIPVHGWDGPTDDWVELRNHVRFKVCTGLTCAWSPSGSPDAWLEERDRPVPG